MTGAPLLDSTARIDRAKSSASLGCLASRAHVGQTVAHVPHPMQSSDETTNSSESE